MEICFCQRATALNAQSMEDMPEPVIRHPAIEQRCLPPNKGLGPAPASRSPTLTNATYDQRPGTPSPGVRRYERSVTRSEEIGGAFDSDDAPMVRSTVEARRLRHVNLQYVLVGGPQGNAPNGRAWGWIHNYGYMTIADTLKPAQQLPRYNLASVDTQMVLDRARQSLLRTLYGVEE